jgi:hypothetical protein
VRNDVVALYVDQRGPYPKLVEQWYDEARDARTYAGPLPVVAHPPCGPWGRLKHLCRRTGEKPLAPMALACVQQYGGILEHPRYSSLWKMYGLPLPGHLPDKFGGITLEVSQCDFGHPARKWTWLYCVGLRRQPEMPERREPTHWISGGRGRKGKKAKTTPVPEGIKVCSAQQRRRTPIAFAEWLLELAASARPSAVSPAASPGPLRDRAPRDSPDTTRDRGEGATAPYAPGPRASLEWTCTEAGTRRTTPPPSRTMTTGAAR